MKITSTDLEKIIDADIEAYYVENNIEAEMLEHYKQLLQNPCGLSDEDNKIGALLTATFAKTFEASLKSFSNILIETGLLTLE